MSAVRAVVFDLYGTLIQVDQSVFQRQARRILAISRREWTEHVLNVLLVTPFDSRESFVDHLVSVFAPAAPEQARRQLLSRLDDELQSARAFDGVSALLAFLGRRGLRLGLISNLAAPYREPLDSLGLRRYFDAVAFSCDRGCAKPDPRIYTELSAELGVEPAEVLMVGDSTRNDVEAPRSLGMRSMRVWPDGETTAPTVFQVGWLDMEPRLPTLPATEVEPHESGLKALVEEGSPLEAHENHVLTRLQPVPDDDQGRYNLVMTAKAEPADGGAAQRVYLKRYLLPDSAYLEEFAHVLLRLVGIETPSAGILAGAEPVLWSSAAPGRKVERLAPSPELAFDIGRHGASAYLFANADYRPRNAFLVTEGGGPRLVMVDYEHCLFNLALDLEGVASPYDPHALDALGDRELTRRIRKRVITPRTCRRNFREFFGPAGRRRELIESFREGWFELTSSARRERARLEELLRRRVHTAPYLILGTRAYRRAMTGIDVEDLLARLDEEPEQVLAGWMSPIVGGAVP